MRIEDRIYLFAKALAPAVMPKFGLEGGDRLFTLLVRHLRLYRVWERWDLIQVVEGCYLHHCRHCNLTQETERHTFIAKGENPEWSKQRIQTAPVVIGVIAPEQPPVDPPL